MTKIFQCKKCGTLFCGESTPNTSGCPSGGNHQWNKLGERGNTQYQCKKCGTAIGSKLTPNTSGCPCGGNHQWNKL